MRYITKEVLQTKEALLGIVGMSDLAEAAGMLTAYANLLERSPRVTNEVIERACKIAFEHPYGLVQGVPWPDGWDNDEQDRSRAAMCAALEAVWPVVAEPAQPLRGSTHCDNCGCTWLDDGLNPIGCPYCKQPADSGRVTELLAYLDNQAQHPRDQFGNGSNKPNPTLKAWYAKQAAIVRALAAQGRPATPILNIRCDSVALDGVKGSTYLPVVRVEAEDDGSFTAVTNYWPAEHDEIAEEAWRAFYDAADKVQKESQSNG